jgi:hypothetical protein
MLPQQSASYASTDCRVISSSTLSVTTLPSQVMNGPDHHQLVTSGVTIALGIALLLLAAAICCSLAAHNPIARQQLTPGAVGILWCSLDVGCFFV